MIEPTYVIKCPAADCNQMMYAADDRFVCDAHMGLVGSGLYERYRAVCRRLVAARRADQGVADEVRRWNRVASEVSGVIRLAGAIIDRAATMRLHAMQIADLTELAHDAATGRPLLWDDGALRPATPSRARLLAGVLAHVVDHAVKPA